MQWFDAHLDFSYLALRGRDLLAPLGPAAGGAQPAALTFPSLAAGQVRWAVGTIFTFPGHPGESWGYGDNEDREGAHAAGRRQLALYHEWERQGHIRLVRHASDLELPVTAPAHEPLRVILLMEGADPIRQPAEAAWWYAQGLRVVGLAWTPGTRYAAGDELYGIGEGPCPGRRGLTSAGRELVAAMDALGMIHDLAHLEDQAASELLALTRRPVMNSHSAARSLQGEFLTRHIADWQLRALAARGGMLGVPLFRRFLSNHPRRRPPVARVADHLDHCASVMGTRALLGLGSDLDGGFTANDLPLGMGQPADYGLLTEELARRGWRADELRGFASAHWQHFFHQALGANNGPDGAPGRGE